MVDVRGTIRDTSGESITETLVSVLIITLVMTMVAGAVTAASKMNKQAKDTELGDLSISEAVKVHDPQDVSFTVSYADEMLPGEYTGDGGDFSVQVNAATGGALAEDSPSEGIHAGLYQMGGYYFYESELETDE